MHGLNQFFLASRTSFPVPDLPSDHHKVLYMWAKPQMNWKLLYKEKSWLPSMLIGKQRATDAAQAHGIKILSPEISLLHKQY